MKDHLIFDVSDAQTILDSDSVGAFVRAGTDGDLIGSQTLDSQEWLNTASILHTEDGNPVNNANPLAVNVVTPLTIDVQLEGIYDVGTNANPDNAGIILHTRSVTPGDAEQVERTTAGLLATIASGDLTKVHAIDTNSFMYAIDDVTGGAELLSKDNTSNGLNVHIAGMDGTLTVSDAALANTAIVSNTNTLAVADTAQAVVTSPLANRKYLWTYNFSNQQVYVGGAGVSAANGFPFSPGSYLEMRAGAAVPVNFIGRTGQTPEIRTLELS